VRLIGCLLRAAFAFVPMAGAMLLCGCGAAGNMGSQAPPISVSLANPMVVVPQSGAPTIVAIKIVSTSETALVSFVGLPGDVQVGYAASDTSPSGILKFIGGPAAPLGTYMPILTVKSAGQTASTTFTLIVTAK
jgi:hypothetical protein